MPHYRTYKTYSGARRRQVELEKQHPEKLFTISTDQSFKYVVAMACGYPDVRSRWAYCE